MRFDLEALSLPVPAGPGAGVQPDVQPSGPSAEGGRSDGQPLLLAIDTVDEDPDQPRREFDPQALEELAATITEFGVRQPVSVRPHPDVPGRWLLNFGCRRLRASRLAGRTEIPAFVDDAVDSYVKVIENEQREALTPLEVAMFIQQRLALGESQADIARRLGKGRAYVTFAMALIDAPDWLMAAYREGRCRGMRALYELRRAGMPTGDAAPAEQSDETRSTLTESVKAMDAADASADEVPQSGSPGRDVDLPISSKPMRESSASVRAPSEQQRRVRSPTPTRLVVTVEIDGQPMELVLDNLPVDPMSVHVRAVDGEDLKTVPIESVTLVGLARR